MSIWFIWIFLAAMLIGIPIAFALGIAPVIGWLIDGKPVFLKLLPQRLFIGINQFPLLAIPLFMLAGEIMNVGGITVRLVAFASALVGHLRGGLAQVNVLSSMLFAGLSGSAVADTSALGSILIPAMEKDGYTRRFAAAVTAASSVIGPIIPPSIIMVIYALVMDVSVGGLFAAGIVPGLLMGIFLMLAVGVMARRRDFPRRAERASAPELWRAGRSAFLPLLTPVIILGGILSGVFTPTEAAGAAVAYALLVSFVITRDLRVADLKGVLFRAGIASATVLLVVGMATVFAGIVTLSGLPATLTAAVFGLTDNPYLVLFLVNVLLLLVGMFLDAGPAILVLGPLLGPTMAQLGVDPLHFAVVMCVNLTVGLATPPMGLVLFVASTLTRLPVMHIAREIMPFIGVHVILIFVVTYVPALSLTLPRWLGLGG